MNTRLHILLLSGLLTGLSACAGTSTTTNNTPMSPEAIKRLQEIAENELQQGSMLPLRFQAQLQVIGNVPYDKSTLPLVSPDGNAIATSVGMAPEPSTLLAAPGSPSPLATGVEVWHLDESTGTFTSRYKLEPPLLLGRSADKDGFLVESPSPEGPRRIGKVSWASGELTWLVEDDRVNAFATIGPSGQLAWSSRPVGQAGFTLVVRNAEDSELEIKPLDGNWYFPTWSTRNDRLYAFWLSPTNHLQLVSMLTLSADAMASSMKNLDLGENRSGGLAYRAVAAQPVIQDLPPPPTEELLFWHPREKYLVAWNPEEASPFVLLSGAMAAAPDVSGRYIVTTPDELRYVDPSRMHQSVRLHNEVAVPFRTTSNSGRLILLTPGTDRVAVRALTPTVPAKTVSGPAPAS